MKLRRLWVVEVWDDVLGWRPAIKAAISREHGRINLRWWRSKYHDRTDKFRLVRYEPTSEGGE